MIAIICAKAIFVGFLRRTDEEPKEFAMLVLSRKKNESIVINDDITIVVVEIRGDKVRLGVEAPKDVPVHRREVFDAIHRNESSSSRQNAGAPVNPGNSTGNGGNKQ